MYIGEDYWRSLLRIEEVGPPDSYKRELLADFRRRSGIDNIVAVIQYTYIHTYIHTYNLVHLLIVIHTYIHQFFIL